jgi:hypothetical protein
MLTDRSVPKTSSQQSQSEHVLASDADPSQSSQSPWLNGKLLKFGVPAIVVLFALMGVGSKLMESRSSNPTNKALY